MEPTALSVERGFTGKRPSRAVSLRQLAEYLWLRFAKLDVAEDYSPTPARWPALPVAALCIEHSDGKLASREGTPLYRARALARQRMGTAAVHAPTSARAAKQAP
jgi:hypothetical protein